jgi:hypothetical protein
LTKLVLYVTDMVHVRACEIVQNAVTVLKTISNNTEVAWSVAYWAFAVTSKSALDHLSELYDNGHNYDSSLVYRIQ